MNRDEVLADVESKLRQMEGFRGLQVLDQEFRERLLELERTAEDQGASGGLMAFVNEGLWETIKRQELVALVLDRTSGFITQTKRLMQLKDKKGQVLGEWANAERIDQLKGEPGISFLGTDFILYQGVKMEGEPFFVLQEVEFPFLLGVEGIKNVTSCSPSGPADEYVRTRLGFNDPQLWSHLVGFDYE